MFFGLGNNNFCPDSYYIFRQNVCTIFIPIDKKKLLLAIAITQKKYESAIIAPYTIYFECNEAMHGGLKSEKSVFYGSRLVSPKG